MHSTKVLSMFRQNQESYIASGGFDAADDDYEEKREKIAEAAQKSGVSSFLFLVYPVTFCYFRARFALRECTGS
jgi:hypothetical protein